MSKYCKKCGLPLDEGTKVCPSCGEPVVEVTVEEPDFEKKEEKSKFEREFDKFNDTEDKTAQFDSKDVEDNKIISLFSYLGILFLIPMIAANQSKFAKFHVNQGIVLFIADLVLGVLMRIFGWTFGLIGLGWIAAIVNSALGVVILVFVILGIVNAVQGKAKRLPVIGKFEIYK